MGKTVGWEKSLVSTAGTTIRELSKMPKEERDEQSV